MKTPTYYIALILAVASIGCTTQATHYDTEISVLIDRTDRLSVYPTAERILALAELTENTWQGVKIRVSYISDKDINEETIFALPQQNRLLYGIKKREAEVARFVKNLSGFFASVDTTSTFGHSIIYRSVARHANILSTSHARKKHLLVYSNMMENSEVWNFYDPATLTVIRENPEAVCQVIERSVPLGTLSGVDIWLLHTPATYEENTIYMSVARVWATLFEQKGARVHIQRSPDEL